LRQDIFYGEDKKEKTEKLDKALAEQVPALLKLIQNLYEENQAATGNSGYLVGNGLTYADVALVNAYPWLSDKTEATFNALPHLKQHYEKIRNLPQLKSFYEQRAKVRFSIYLPE
jgi:glutathione S-transferase